MTRLELLRFETTLLQQPQVLQEASSQGAASRAAWTHRFSMDKAGAEKKLQLNLGLS